MINSQISPEVAARELLDRRRARSGIVHFTNYTYHRYKADLFHELVGEALDLVIGDRLHKLIIMAPPQHGKSELASVRLPAKWTGVRPTDPIILASYEATLAASKSKQARAIVESDEFRSLYGDLGPSEMVPVFTEKDTRAGDLWKNNQGGQVRSAGVGGGLTGHPGMLGIIDDPVKNRKDADSQVMRDGNWEWWTSTYRTRIWEGGSHVLIMTRWHYDDLAGRLIREQGAIDWSQFIDGVDPGDGWVILRCPALAETQFERDESNALMGIPAGMPDPLGRDAGEPLAPNRFSKKALESIKKDIGPRDWASLYQGTPRPADGQLFEVDLINWVTKYPMMQRVVRYWDLAATKDGGARSSGFKMGLGSDGDYYLLDVVFGHWNPAQLDREIKSTAERDGRSVEQWFEQEPGSSGKIVKHYYLQLLNGYTVWFDKVTGEKTSRWGPFASQMAGERINGLVGSWNQTVIEELSMQPHAPLKDITDAGSGAFTTLAEDKRVTSDNIDFFTPAKDRVVINYEPARSDTEVDKMLAEQERILGEING